MKRVYLLSCVSGLAFLTACESEGSTEVYSSERRTSRAIASSDASSADTGAGPGEFEDTTALPEDTTAPVDVGTDIAQDTSTPDTDIAEELPDIAEPADTTDTSDSNSGSDIADVSDVSDISDVSDTSDVPDTSTPVAKRVCYAGGENTWNVCFNLVPISQGGSGYNYPSSNDARYRKPEYILDLQGLDLSVKVAPNFRMSEFLSLSKGRYGILSPQAVQRLQQVRQGLGTALNVNSGYRNVSYNASVGGATFSRHMYGDGFDIQNNSATSLQTIANQCSAKGAGYTQLYTTHVHCDWRNTTLPADFWSNGHTGPLAFMAPWHHEGHDHGPIDADPWLETWGEVSSTLSEDGKEWILQAHWSGFDEGTPWVSWQIQHADHTQVIEPETIIRVPVGQDLHVSWSISRLVEGTLTLP